MLGAHQRKAAVNLLFMGHWVLTFCFTISAFVVAGTANAGFNALLTALMYVAFGAGAFFTINRNQNATMLGILIGAAGSFSLLSLQTAIFWGQLSNCQKLPVGAPHVEHYSCENKAAMSAVCAFAALLFLLQLVLTIGLFTWRDELAHDMLMYSQVAQSAGYENGGGGHEYAPYGSSHGFQGSQGSYQGGVPHQDV